MGYKAEPGAGAIYRYYRGTLHNKLFDQKFISNAICFNSEGSTAYFTDTKDGRVVQQGLDADGWTCGTRISARMVPSSTRKAISGTPNGVHHASLAAPPTEI